MADSDVINKDNKPPVTNIPGAGSVPPKSESQEKKPIIDDAKLFELLHLVEELRKSDEENKKEIERLRYAADKNRVAQYDSKEATKKSIVPKCTVSFWNGKVVLAWRMLPQEVFYGQNGVYHEKQDVEMTVKGESQPVIVAYKDWFKQITKKPADILSRTTDNDGHVIMALELEDGSQIALDSSFIN